MVEQWLEVVSHLRYRAHSLGPCQNQEKLSLL